MIRNIDIANFKSIRNLSLNCKKVNIFIGKPNVGKSNILECLTAFGNLKAEEVRLENIRNLFYDQDIDNCINISVDNFSHFVRFEKKENLFFSYFLNSLNLPSTLKNGLNPEFSTKIERASFFKELDKNKSQSGSRIHFNDLADSQNYNQIYKMNAPRIKKYSFKKFRLKNGDAYRQENGDALNNPYGENLFEILKNDKNLRKEVSKLFEDYGYNLIIDFVSNQAEIHKLVDNVSYKIPYSLIADTLQRMVFFIVAIRSNEDCSILLEEPENHSFPPYIRDIALEITKSNNQFFIATHSPYLFNTLLSECKKEELAVNVVSYENYQTKVKTLDEAQISEIMNFGVDAFFNIDSL